MRAAAQIRLDPFPTVSWRWRTAAERARARVVAGATGRVLALDARTAVALRSVPEVAEVVEVANPPDAAALPEGIDLAVGAFTLAGLPDLPALLAAIRDALAPGGAIRFCELVPGTGVERHLDRLLAPPRRAAVVPSLGRWYPVHDVPAEIRRAGYTVTDIERFPMPTLVAPLRHCAVGSARPSRWRSA